MASVKPKLAVKGKPVVIVKAKLAEVVAAEVATPPIRASGPPNGLFCADCKQPQWDTPSGTQCPNGHGGEESLEAVDVELAHSRPKVIEKIGRATGQGDGTVWFPTTGQILPIAPSKSFEDYSHGDIEETAKAAKDLVTRLEQEAEKAEQEEAAAKAALVRSPFADACDEMVKAIADTQMMFARRFRVAAKIPLLGDKFLSLHKHGKLGRILAVEGYDSKGTASPLLSTNLECKLAAVDLIGELWDACVAADEEALQRVLAANVKLKTFNTATAILDKAFCNHTAKAASVLPNREEWES
jgi:hypothetical protein